MTPPSADADGNGDRQSAAHIIDVGRRAVLVELDSLDEASALAGRLRAAAPPGVEDVVCGLRTVLVRGTGDLRAAVGSSLLVAADRPTPVPHVVRIPVVYDGEDLAEVADRCGVENVVGLHAGATYTVAFCGFAPGFAYLTGLPTALRLPRRATPRPRVPAGSVAIAGDLAAVYPTASPGGWHLLGRTDLTLFDVDRDPPALLGPGTVVRFVPQ